MAKARKTSQTNDADVLPLPSNYSFMRSIEPTEAAMYAVDAADAGEALSALVDRVRAKVRPVTITVTTTRGTQASFAAKEPHLRIDIPKNAINRPNISTVETATLPADAAWLGVTGYVRFAPGALRPLMQDSAEFTEAVAQFVQAFKDKGGFDELALRYGLNLANGAWMWRNRLGDDLTVRLSADGCDVTFVPGDVDMSHGFSLQAITDEAKRAVFARLVRAIASALAGEMGPTKTLLVRLAAVVHMGPGATVYPSQEFTQDNTDASDDGEGSARSRNGRPDKILSRTRLADGTEQATLHARKVGNAVRTIDTWHGVPGVGAIAAEPFGADTHMATAYRIHGNDLYTYLRDPVALKDGLAEGLTPQALFTVACLVRGGVYGMGKKKQDQGEEAGAETADAAE